MENIPEVENKYKELSFEDKQKEIETIKLTLSDEEAKKLFTVETDTTVVPPTAPVVDTSVKALDPAIEAIGQTMYADAKERTKDIYPDYDFSGIDNAKGLDITQKASLMSSVAIPDAKKMATIEKNLKSKNAEGTPDNKTPAISPPASVGVDASAGEKLVSLMSEKLNLDYGEDK